MLAGYLLTLAPSVTFWDAGELIAAAHNLGIPHPPGTPLFVLLGHAWAEVFPFGEFAWRTNLMSATFSALGAAGFFLVAHEALGGATGDMAPGPRRLVRIGGGMAAGLFSAFTYTQWQNSTETEAYSVATFTIALICWLCLRWRAARGSDRGLRILLLVLYLAGLSMGNHLLALLAGPAVVMFLVATIAGDPAPSAEARRSEWATVAVVAGLWALLIGTGLGSTALVVVGGVCFVAAAVFASTAGMLPFAGLAVALAGVGVTTYLFLYIRAGQGPIPNEADPSTWDALLAVIRRAQYPVRTPFDDPTVLHGPDNPGRSITLIWLQLQNYFQYFNWQWARTAAARGFGALDGQLAGSLLAAALGLRGFFEQRRTDRGGWWLLFTLFLVTGLGLVAYMNFKPGASLGYDLFPQATDHEVRERDYFFVVSFLVWGVWAGIGIATLVRDGLRRVANPALRAAVPALFLLALVPAVGNAAAASRRHGADARLAGDFAYDLLNSMPPYGVLVTFGDNDTFPLWWAQEVQGIRRDVTVLCLALANTGWYARQLRDSPVRPFEPEMAPAIWKEGAPPRPDWPTLNMTDEQIDAAYPRRIAEAVTVNYGPYRQTYPAGTAFYTSDFVLVRTIQQNLGRRPIAWSVTAGRNYLGLDPYLLQRGLAISLLPAAPDSAAPGIDHQRLTGVLLDVPVTQRLVWEAFRYSELATRPHGWMDVTGRAFASTLALPPTQLGVAWQAWGQDSLSVNNLELANALSPNPALASMLSNLRFQSLQQGADSP